MAESRGPRHPNPARKRQSQVAALVSRLRGVPTVDLLGVVCARLTNAGRPDLARFIVSNVSGQIPERSKSA